MLHWERLKLPIITPLLPFLAICCNITLPMKKESIVAILIGFGLGLTAALAILVLPQKISNLTLNIPFVTKRDKVPVRVDQDSSIPTITPALERLAISEPEDRLITQKNSVSIRGTAAANSLVVLLTTNNTNTTTTDNEGNFEFKPDLLEGRNDIQIAVYLEGKDPEFKSIEVYSMRPEKLK